MHSLIVNPKEYFIYSINTNRLQNFSSFSIFFLGSILTLYFSTAILLPSPLTQTMIRRYYTQLIMVFGFVFLTYIFVLNVLIAILSLEYNQLNKGGRWRFERAMLIRELQAYVQILQCFSCEFHKTLQKVCVSPLPCQHCLRRTGQTPFANTCDRPRSVTVFIVGLLPSPSPLPRVRGPDQRRMFLYFSPFPL
jgi:hypothetical protein